MWRRAEDDWVEAKVANGRSLGEGDCGLGIRMGVLAISHLNISFAYSKLNKHIIIYITSSSL